MIRNLGNIDIITKISIQVDEETEIFRSISSGQTSLECPDCGEEVARGNLRSHRRGREIMAVKIDV